MTFSDGRAATIFASRLDFRCSADVSVFPILPASEAFFQRLCEDMCCPPLKVDQRSSPTQPGIHSFLLGPFEERRDATKGSVRKARTVSYRIVAKFLCREFKVSGCAVKLT
jgi:hypothetical protein